MLAQEFKFHPSKQYLFFLLSTLFVSVVIAITLPISLLLKCIILLFVCVQSGITIWRFGLMRSRNSIRAIRLQGEGVWHLSLRDRILQAELSSDSTVTRFISVLRFKVADQFKLQTCIIFRDSLAPDYYRKLIVLLK